MNIDREVIVPSFEDIEKTRKRVNRILKEGIRNTKDRILINFYKQHLICKRASKISAKDYIKASKPLEIHFSAARKAGFKKNQLFALGIVASESNGELEEQLARTEGILRHSAKKREKKKEGHDAK